MTKPAWVMPLSIAPNTTVEAMNVTAMIDFLLFDLFVRSITNAVGAPIARIHVFMDKKMQAASQPVNLTRSASFEHDDIQAFV